MTIPDHTSFQNCLYFIQSGKGPVKIGVAVNVSGRLADLQVANPENLKVIQQFVVSNKSLAFELERWMHERFHSQRIRGEWYRLNQIDIKLITNFDEYHFAGAKTSEDLQDHCMAFKLIPEPLDFDSITQRLWRETADRIGNEEFSRMTRVDPAFLHKPELRDPAIERALDRVNIDLRNSKVVLVG